MNVKYPHRSVIPPVPDGVTRPLWSVMIPTYNCAKYLRETLTSVLAQDPGADVMQIEVVDDCSSKDDPAAVVEELGKGRVSFYRQPENVGYIRNFETCLLRSRGRLIHLLHGDDCVKDGFYRKLQAAFDNRPEIGAAFCSFLYVDENHHEKGAPPLEQPESGILHNWLERIAVECRIQTPAIVVRRDVYEKLGGFDRRFSCCGEDWEMWVRIAASYPVWYEVERLAIYRIHSTSLSRVSTRTGADMRDFRIACEIIQQYLPAQIAKKLSHQAKEKLALYAIQYLAPRMLDRNDFKAIYIQIQEAINFSQSLKVIQELAHLILQITKYQFKKIISNKI